MSVSSAESLPTGAVQASRQCIRIGCCSKAATPDDRKTELLILDEPTNGLDPAGMAEMRTLIRRLGTGQRSVLLSSHLLGEAQQICDRVGVIVRGRLIAESTVDELRGATSLLLIAQPVDEAARLAAFKPWSLTAS